MNELVCEQVSEGVSLHKYLCSMYFNSVRCEKNYVKKYIIIYIQKECF